MSTNNTGAGGSNTSTTEGSGTASQEQVYQLIVDSIEKERQLFEIQKQRLKLVEEYGEIQKEGLKVAQAELNQIVSRSQKIAEEISQGEDLLEILKEVTSLSEKRKQAIQDRLKFEKVGEDSLLTQVDAAKFLVEEAEKAVKKKEAEIKVQRDLIKEANLERETAKRDLQRKRIDFKQYEQLRNDAKDKELNEQYMQEK